MQLRISFLSVVVSLLSVTLVEVLITLEAAESVASVSWLTWLDTALVTLVAALSNELLALVREEAIKPAIIAPKVKRPSSKATHQGHPQMLGQLVEHFSKQETFRTEVPVAVVLTLPSTSLSQYSAGCWVCTAPESNPGVCVSTASISLLPMGLPLMEPVAVATAGMLPRVETGPTYVTVVPAAPGGAPS